MTWNPLYAASGAVALALSIASPAVAEKNEFDVSIVNGQVVVTAHRPWHINKEFPWKLVVGDTKFDKTKFALAETTATISGAPKGVGKLKGAVCSEEACHTFEKDVAIP